MVSIKVFCFSLRRKRKLKTKEFVFRVQLMAKLKRYRLCSPQNSQRCQGDWYVPLTLSSTKEIGGLFLFLLMLVRKLGIASMQEQNNQLKEMLHESVAQLAECRKIGAMRRKTLGPLHWMRYVHEEESDTEVRRSI